MIPLVDLRVVKILLAAGTALMLASAAVTEVKGQRQVTDVITETKGEQPKSKHHDLNFITMLNISFCSQ